MERTSTFAERHVIVQAEATEKAMQRASDNAVRTYHLAGVILAPDHIVCDGVTRSLKEIEASIDSGAFWLYLTIAGPDFSCVKRTWRGLYPRQFAAQINTRARQATENDWR